MDEVAGSLMAFLADLAEKEELSCFQVFQALSSVFVVLGKVWNLNEQEFVSMMNEMIKVFESCDMIRKEGSVMLVPKGKKV